MTQRPIKNHRGTAFCPSVLAFCAFPLACAQPSSELAERAESPASATTQLIHDWIERGEEVGFSYGVVTPTGTLFEFTHGRLDAAQTTEVDAQTMFLSASTTKIITALAVLRLVEQQQVQMSDPLTRHLPELPYGSDVTIERLLNHSAGIPNPLPLNWVHRKEQHAQFSESSALSQVIAESARKLASAGKEYRYSNLGYWLLGALVERVSGRKYATFIQEQLLAPLGVDERDFCFDPHDQTVARGHYERFSLLGVVLPLLTEHTHRTTGSGKWGRFEELFMNGLAYGGGFATARGYGRVLGALLDESNSLLSKESRALLFSTQRDNAGRALGVSLAFRQGQLGQESYFSKPGGGPGFSSNVRIYRRLGIATVFLSNRMRVSEAAIEKISDQLDAPFVSRHALEISARSPRLTRNSATTDARGSDCEWRHATEAARTNAGPGSCGGPCGVQGCR